MPTKLGLQSTPNPSLFGTPLLLTATLTVPPPGYGVTSGTVSFFDGFTLLGSSAVRAGIASLSPPGPYLGSHSLTAVYSGGGKFFGSISPADLQFVESAPTSVPNGAPLAFALEAIAPNPTRVNRMSVAFTLPTSSAARLELWDVSGRRMAEREVGSLGAGRHAVDLAAGRRLAPGLYLVRLSQGANVRSARVVVLK